MEWILSVAIFFAFLLIQGFFTPSFFRGIKSCDSADPGILNKIESGMRDTFRKIQHQNSKQGFLDIALLLSVFQFYWQNIGSDSKSAWIRIMRMGRDVKT